MATNIYERAGPGVMTRRSFYFVMCGILTYGFIGSGIAASMTATWQPTIWSFLGVALLPFVGVLLSYSSSAALSFLGFTLVAIPFGALLGPLLATTELSHPGVVADTAFLTAVVTAVMGASGLAFPNFYRSIGGALFGALLVLVAVSFMQIFIPGLREFGVINYVGAGVFALYIGYDMYRASDIPATLDNAVDMAVALYLDILNLFLYLLKIKTNSTGGEDGGSDSSGGGDGS